MGIGEGIDTERCWQVVVEQRLAMAELLAGLSEAEWEHQSLCPVGVFATLPPT